MSWVIASPGTGREEELGGKARALARLEEAGFPVPAWFAVSPEAFAASVAEAALPAGADGARGGDALARLRPAETVRREVNAAALALDPDGAGLAVRSSAAEEDGARHSYAGQLESYLFVQPADAADRMADVWRSGFSERLLAYRRERGLDEPPRPPAVLVQRLVVPEVSGVAFSADPVTGRRGTAVVSAVYGFATALVSGECDADSFEVDRAGAITARRVADKPVRHAPGPAPGGIARVPVEASLRSLPALTNEQAAAVAALARAAERHFGTPQDIEWALSGGRLFLLQSRPITSLAALADPEGERNLWDNSNITESYGGVTTPLTFSFARRAYEEVYRQFCRLMGVPAAQVADHADTFRRMIGLVRGRVYYNLLSWYRMLALLPGFSVNRRFMEQMMGVKEGLPDDVLARARTSAGGPLLDALRLAGTLAGLVANHAGLPRRTRAFYARLDEALAPRDLAALRLDELYGHYRELEGRLLTRWDAPIVNDFFAMVYYGLLRRACGSWCGDREGTLQNALLSGGGGMVSTEPFRLLRELAAVAAADAGLARSLREDPLARARRAAAANPGFDRLLGAYLERFGDRCLDELKLETATLGDDPLPLLRAVGRLAARPLPQQPPPGAPPEDSARREAERATARALRGSPVKAAAFRWILRHARARVRDRENLRFERTRVFGRARRIFVEIGARLHALGVLDDPRDVFFCEVEELLGFVSGTATCTDLRGLAAVRKAEHERHLAATPPASRFETRGAVHQGNRFEATAPPASVAGETRAGIGCCPGVVEGRARVVRDPRDADLLPGEVLVAERTDPGWIMLFPMAAGILVERGSLLSHTAIVARELGIPAVVSVPGLTAWIATGDLVRLDGRSGEVRRLAP